MLEQSCPDENIHWELKADRKYHTHALGGVRSLICARNIVHLGDYY
jgi:hypothetical protein